MGEKVGHHRTGSFPANMGPAAYNKRIFFLRSFALSISAAQHRCPWRMLKLFQELNTQYLTQNVFLHVNDLFRLSV